MGKETILLKVDLDDSAFSEKAKLLEKEFIAISKGIDDTFCNIGKKANTNKYLDALKNAFDGYGRIRISEPWLEYSRARKEYVEYVISGNRENGTQYKKRFQKLGKNYDEAFSRFKALGGAELAEIEKKLNKAAKILDDLDMRVLKLDIQLSPDEYRKTLRMIYNLKKELINVERVKNKISVIQAGIITPEQEDRISNIRNRINKALETATAQAGAKYQKDYEEVLREEREAMQSYLREYGTVEEKRLALTEQYGEKIRRARTEGERLTLQKGLEKGLRDIELEAFKGSDLYVRAFGDMERASEASIEAIISKLKELRDATVKELKPDEMKEYNDAIRRAEEELLSRKDVFEQYRVARERYATALANQRAAENMLKGARNSGDGTVITGSVTKPVDGVLRVVPVVKTLEEAQDDVRRATDETTEAYGKLQERATAVVDVTQELLGSITQAGDRLSGLGDTFGNSGLKLMGSLLSGAGSLAGSGLSALEGITTAFAKGADDNYLTGGLGGTLTRISSVIGGVGVAIQGVQMISGLVGTFKSMADKDNEERIERLQESIEALTESNEELQRALEDQFSVTARDNLAEQNRNLQQQQALIQQQIAEEQGKKDPDGARVEEWQKQLRDINRQIEENKQAMIEALTGTSTREAVTSFSDGLVGAWENHTDAVKASVTTARSLIRTGLIQYLNDQLSGLGKAFNENLAAALEDGIISTWEDAQLMAQAEQIALQGERFRERFGKYLDAGGESSVTGSGNATSGMSQDTGDAIEGRMTAMQIAVEAIRGQGEASNILIQSLGESITPLVAVSLKNSMTLSELHGLAVLAIDYLDTIARNTGELAGIKRHLARIEQNTNNL